MIILETSWDGPWFFVCGADPQFGMIDNYIRKIENGGWEEEIKLCREIIQKINVMQPKPRFFVVCGDLVDAMPGKLS